MNEPSFTQENADLSEDQRKDALLKLIRKGAPSVPPKEKESTASERSRITLRLQSKLMERIEKSLDDRIAETPVNTWITEAIVEKLKKEGY